MTLEDMEAEIATLRQEQALQKAHWRRWGVASSVAGLILVIVVLLQAALTAAAPAPAMLFIVLAFVFVGTRLHVGRTRLQFP